MESVLSQSRREHARNGEMRNDHLFPTYLITFVPEHGWRSQNQVSIGLVPWRDAVWCELSSFHFEAEVDGGKVDTNSDRT